MQLLCDVIMCIYTENIQKCLQFEYFFLMH